MSFLNEKTDFFQLNKWLYYKKYTLVERDIF